MGSFIRRQLGSIAEPKATSWMRRRELSRWGREEGCERRMAEVWRNCSFGRELHLLHYF